MIFRSRWARRPGRRRANGRVLTRVHAHSFKPRHCAGDTCMHNHQGEPAVWRDFSMTGQGR